MPVSDEDDAEMMEQSDLREAFKELACTIEEQIQFFSGRADDSRNRYYRIRLAIIFLSALVPISLGFQEFTDGAGVWLGRIALVIGVVVTALTSYESEFNYKRTWLAFRMTANRLKSVRHGIRIALATNRTSQEDFDALSGQFQASLDSANSEWFTLRDSELGRPANDALEDDKSS